MKNFSCHNPTLKLSDTVDTPKKLLGTLDPRWTAAIKKFIDQVPSITKIFAFSRFTQTEDDQYEMERKLHRYNIEGNFESFNFKHHDIVDPDNENTPKQLIKAGSFDERDFDQITDKSPETNKNSKQNKNDSKPVVSKKLQFGQNNTHVLMHDKFTQTIEFKSQLVNYKRKLLERIEKISVSAIDRKADKEMFEVSKNLITRQFTTKMTKQKKTSTTSTKGIENQQNEVSCNVNVEDNVEDKPITNKKKVKNIVISNYENFHLQNNKKQSLTDNKPINTTGIETRTRCKYTRSIDDLSAFKSSPQTPLISKTIQTKKLSSNDQLKNIMQGKSNYIVSNTPQTNQENLQKNPTLKEKPKFCFIKEFPRPPIPPKNSEGLSNYDSKKRTKSTVNQVSFYLIKKQAQHCDKEDNQIQNTNDQKNKMLITTKPIKDLNKKINFKMASSQSPIKVRLDKHGFPNSPQNKPVIIDSNPVNFMPQINFHEKVRPKSTYRSENEDNNDLKFRDTSQGKNLNGEKPIKKLLQPTSGNYLTIDTNFDRQSINANCDNSTTKSGMGGNISPMKVKLDYNKIASNTNSMSKIPKSPQKRPFLQTIDCRDNKNFLPMTPNKSMQGFCTFDNSTTNNISQFSPLNLKKKTLLNMNMTTFNHTGNKKRDQSVNQPSVQDL